MNKDVVVKSLETWFLFIPIVIVNGAMRNFLYKPFTGELLAHQISSVIASLAFIIFSYFMLKNKILNLATKELFAIGFLWVALTIIFEFGFGHFIMGNSWDKLLHDYNLFQGRIWIIFLAIEIACPFIIKKFTT